MIFHQCPYCSDGPSFINIDQFKEHLQQKHNKGYEEMEREFGKNSEFDES